MKNGRCQKIHGWLSVDKPVGMTSFQVVGRLRAIIGGGKVGHAGTLDPLASGVLPIAFGQATRTVSYLMDAQKIYAFTVKWGEKTTTYDREGEITDYSDHRPDPKDIEKVLPRFMGTIEQTPPLYSAIKVSGRRAYDLARKGETFLLKSRPIEIFNLSLSQVIDKDHAMFYVTCGKGTYVRSLANDLAQALGTCGHIHTLRRVRVGAFHENMSMGFKDCRQMTHEDIRPFLQGIETVLDDIPALSLTNAQATRLRWGQAIDMAFNSEHLDSKQTIRAMNQGDLVAIGHYDGKKIQPVRVFQHQE